MTNQNPVEIDNSTGEATPLAPTGKASRYRADLSTVQEVRKEMAKVYRESRSNLLETSDLTKFVYCLNIIGKTIESSDLEKRIEALEGNG